VPRTFYFSPFRRSFPPSLLRSVIYWRSVWERKNHLSDLGAENKIRPLEEAGEARPSPQLAKRIRILLIGASQVPDTTCLSTSHARSLSGFWKLLPSVGSSRRLGTDYQLPGY
jgi:hypothetical protein